MFETNGQIDYTGCKTKNSWCSIKAHVQDEVGSVSQYFWTVNAATTTFMDLCNKLPVRLPRCNTKIVDARLTLIFRMWQGVCRYCFCVRTQPTLHLWMFTTNRHLGYPRWKAKNHWCSVDTHFQTGAVTMSLSLLPIKASNMSVIPNSDQITFQLPYLQDQ